MPPVPTLPQATKTLMSSFLHLFLKVGENQTKKEENAASATEIIFGS
jgi:hypothetical protein